MDIVIQNSWLREFLKTPASAGEISRNLSLTSQSVGKITKINSDYLYNIEVTGNRPDAFSVYGIARELAAVLPRFGQKAQLLPIPGVDKATPKVKKGLPLQIEISDHSLVPRFTAIIFDSLAIKPSPKFVQERLENAGIRSLNNVIDISNYLMLEQGQPMHTFDYDKILGAKMLVRQAKTKEKLMTLDGQVRPLPPGTIIIEDGQGRIIDLCGIMGGKNSEVDENTKRVLLFVQTYDPIRIRKSCQALSFRTDAASRFEKGVDPEGVIIAIKRAIKLFKDWSGGKVVSKLFDIYPQPPKPLKVALEKSRLDRLMGVEINLSEASKILESLGFKTEINEKKQSLTAAVPHWRLGDIAIPEDLIEEIARLYGYQNLPDNLPPISFPQKTSPVLNLENTLKQALKNWGYTETPTYTLNSCKTLVKAGIDKNRLLRLANPLSEDLVYLQTSLIPNLLETVAKNITFPEIKIFEISMVYLPEGKNKLPNERPRLTGLLYPAEYPQAKGTVEAILELLGIENSRFSALKNPEKLYFLPKTAAVTLGKDEIGKVGEINPKTAQEFGLTQKLAFFDFDLNLLSQFATSAKRYLPVSKYPPIIEDLSFVVPPKVTVAEIEEAIKLTSPLIKKIELVDIFKEIRTFRVTYQSSQRNLTDKDIRPIREKIVTILEKKLGLRLKQANSS